MPTDHTHPLGTIMSHQGYCDKLPVRVSGSSGSTDAGTFYIYCNQSSQNSLHHLSLWLCYSPPPGQLVLIWLHFAITGVFKVPMPGPHPTPNQSSPRYGIQAWVLLKGTKTENQYSRVCSIYLWPPHIVHLASTIELGSELPDSHSQQGTFFHSRAYSPLAKTWKTKL